jgi:hypothetical protein
MMCSETVADRWIQRCCRASQQEQVSSKKPLEGRLLMESGSITSNVANSGDAKVSSDAPATIAQNESLMALPAVPPTAIPLGGSAAPAVSIVEPPADPASTVAPMLSDSKSATTGIVPFADPFGGFTGHSFFYFCRLVDRVAGSMKHDSAPAEAAESLLSSHTTSPVSHWGACSKGTICCTVAAACLIPLFNASSVKAILPIPFLIIIVLVAFRFGRAAGVLGTLAAAFLFAWFLYEPAGLAVSDPVAKSHLMWMLIIGIVISDLLTRFKTSRIGRHRF